MNCCLDLIVILQENMTLRQSRLRLIIRVFQGRLTNSYRSHKRRRFSKPAMVSCCVGASILRRDHHPRFRDNGIAGQLIGNASRNSIDTYAQRKIAAFVTMAYDRWNVVEN
jgi:hypothetical protein